VRSLVSVAAVSVAAVFVAACFPHAEGLPPSPAELAERDGTRATLPHRPAEAAADGGPSDAGGSEYEEPPEPPAAEARLLAVHVARAVSAGDRRTTRSLVVPGCLEGPCARLVALERTPLVAEGEPTAGSGTRAFALVTRVCDDGPCGKLALLFTRDCSLHGTPFRVAEVREARDELSAWLAAGAAPCPEGKRRPVAPSPFDPSGTPSPVRR